jgi:hypothetical protein
MDARWIGQSRYGSQSTYSSSTRVRPSFDPHRLPPPIRIEAGRVSSDVQTLAFSTDGKTLAGGGGRGPVMLWDVASREELRTLEGTDQRGPLDAILTRRQDSCHLRRSA